MLLALAGCGGASEPPNVLIISIDTLRADRLGCYGYGRETTPALDRFAEERAVRFSRAVAEAPWTLPSHVTMLSGLHPLTHGVREPDEAPAEEVRPLAEWLAGSHYSFAITDGGWLSEGWGFSRGYDSFHARDREVDRAVEEVLQYVRQRKDKGPWFGFLHTYDVHCPYDPPAPYVGTFNSPDAEPIAVAGRCGNPDFNSIAITPGQARFLSDRYDEDLRRVDDALGELFAAFEQMDLWRNTIVVVTSDHGEEFLEHGTIGHERTLSNEVLAIPLLVSAPGVEPRVELGVVGLADIVPTVLELVGREAPGSLDGRSLVPLLHGRTDPGRPEWVLSDLAWQRELLARTTRTDRAVVDLASEASQEGWVAEGARMRAGGFEPRHVETEPREAELRGLGY